MVMSHFGHTTLETDMYADDGSSQIIPVDISITCI